MSKPRTRWTDSEIDLVRTLYPSCDVAEIAHRTGRSCQAVKHKAIELGISGLHHWRGTPLPVGTEILRRGENSYVMVKVATDDGAAAWVRKHHLVWKEATGKLLPAGMRLVFRDGDRRNCIYENLELITDVEAARRVTEYRSYPPALQETIRLLGDLREMIYDRGKHGRPTQSGVRRRVGSEECREA